MNEDQQRFEEERFVEEVGLFLEQMGLPRMAGRVLGRLLISDPPHQSAGELADFLSASRGSVSTTTRLLIQGGLIERVSLPGERRDYFRIKPDAWFQMTKQQLGFLTAFHGLVDRGLELIRVPNPTLGDRLEELKEVCEFYERELPGLIGRWEQQRQPSRRG